MPHPVLRHLRAVAALAAAGACAAALVSFQLYNLPTRGWWLLALGLLLGMLGQLGLEYPAPPPAPPAETTSGWRRWLGVALAAAGAALWAYGVRRLVESWPAGFDAAWTAWPLATALMAFGADLAWARWPRRAAPIWRGWMLAVPAVLVVIAAIYRLGNIADFPGEAAATQVEDFQVGNFGKVFLAGDRTRWEYLSSTWLAAIGLAVGGYTQLAMRVPFAVVSALKLAPMFVWTRSMVGTAGAVIGMALLAPSFWDVVLSRIPNNHNALVVALAFTLLAGPVRRGRPSGYIGLGFLGGYILHEYIAYRPLVVWALIGAAWWSCSDRTVAWPARLARPLMTLVLVVSMITPLFVSRLHTVLRREYVDGWERARGQTGYYNPEDSWPRALQRRITRAGDAAELFVWQGDRSPVRNMSLWPLINPVTAGLLLLGIAGALVHALRPVLLLTLAGFIVHVIGTLVATGNFDVARVGGAVAYVYPLAGIGAAGLLAAVGAAWGAWGRRAVLAALALAVGWAAWSDTTHLRRLWSSVEVRRAHRNELAYLTVWVRDHMQPGERVLGIAPLYTNAVKSHDGIWLMGGPVIGNAVSDVETALRDWLAHPQPTLLFIYVGRSSEDIAAYLHWLFPSLEFRLDRDPLDMGDEVASTHAAAPPPDLAQQLAAMRCRGADAEFQLLGAAGDAPLAAARTVAPFVDRSTWPDAFMEQAMRLQAHRLRVRYAARFAIAAGGEYRFALTTYGGQATLRIDGQRRDGHGFVPVELTPGLHELSVDGEFALIAPSMQLRWSGPDTQNRQALMPLYRLAEPKPDCPPEEKATTDEHG